MVTAIIILSIIGLISATLLYIISRKFHVEEDSRIDEIESILPGANCGGCGYAGCRNFAEQCTKVTSLDSLLCPVGGNEVMQKIAPILGLNAVEKAPRIAVIRCNGSCENRQTGKATIHLTANGGGQQTKECSTPPFRRCSSPSGSSPSRAWRSTTEFRPMPKCMPRRSPRRSASRRGSSRCRWPRECSSHGNSRPS